MGGRRTNLALLLLLATVFLSGWLAFSFYSWPSRFALLLHSLGGLAISGRALLADESAERVRRPGVRLVAGLAALSAGGFAPRIPPSWESCGAKCFFFSNVS